jgi:type IV pilus assembly protein PilX
MGNQIFQQKCRSILMQNHSFPHRNQGGAVLVVCLIMLLLMTLIGTSGMQATSLEEKMAGNMRDRNLSFQAAESALAAGEAFLGSKTTAQLNALVFDCVGPDGLFPQPGTGCAAAQPIWDNINWAANSALYVGALAMVNTNPRYIIEYMGLSDGNGDGDFTDAGVDQRVYRITSRATGGTAEAIVVLQVIYERPV